MEEIDMEKDFKIIKIHLINKQTFYIKQKVNVSLNEQILFMWYIGEAFDLLELETIEGTKLYLHSEDIVCIEMEND